MRPMRPEVKNPAFYSVKQINAWLGIQWEVARQGCGLVYELLQIRFSTAVDESIAGLDLPRQYAVIVQARDFGYITVEARAAMQACWRETGSCPSTGLDPDICPCANHG